MPTTQDRLRGGDLRSIGAADAVAREAEHDPTLVLELVAGLASAEPVVRMRCADALEKVSRTQPAVLAPHSAVLLRLLGPRQPKEVLWHVLQMLPRVAWPASEHAQLIRNVLACLSSSSSIVKTSVMQALFELAHQAPAHAAEVNALLKTLTQNGTPAMRARGNKLLMKQATTPDRVKK